MKFFTVLGQETLKNFELGEVMEESLVKKVTESYLDLMLLINPVI